LEAGNGDVGTSSRALQAELDQAKASLNEKQKELDEYTERVEYLEKEMEEGNNVNKLQVNEMEGINTALQGKLRGERLDAAAKLSRKDEVIGKLQTEIDAYRRTDDLKDLISAKERINANELELDEIKTQLDEALAQIAIISGEKEDLVEKVNVLNKQTKIFHVENKELNAKAQKSHLQVLEWTEKTYDWKSRAETAEKKLRDLNEEESDSGDAAPQGMFLQAVMDTQAKQAQARGSGAGLRRSVMNTLFRTAGDEDNDDLTAEQIRIKNLEERNESLDATIVDLRSELVKTRSAHKDKLYTLEKQVDQLQRENEALKTKNQVLGATTHS
jgi:predicted  nucleic acid-binding Zn-ribbon protein